MQNPTPEVVPTYTEVPVGLDATGHAHASSTAWAPSTCPPTSYWGAQTQRSLIHFSIGDDHMPMEVYHAYGQ